MVQHMNTTSRDYETEALAHLDLSERQEDDQQAALSIQRAQALATLALASATDDTQDQTEAAVFALQDVVNRLSDLESRLRR